MGSFSSSCPLSFFISSTNAHTQREGGTGNWLPVAEGQEVFHKGGANRTPIALFNRYRAAELNCPGGLVPWQPNQRQPDGLCM